MGDCAFIKLGQFHFIKFLNSSLKYKQSAIITHSIFVSIYENIGLKEDYDLLALTAWTIFFTSQVFLLVGANFLTR